MAFLKANPSTNKALNVNLTLEYLSKKESYHKEVCYFKVMNIEMLDVLEEYDSTHSLPIFKNENNEVMLRVYFKNIDSDMVLVKNTVYTTKCRFSKWDMDKKVGFTAYINTIEA